MGLTMRHNLCCAENHLKFDNSYFKEMLEKQYEKTESSKGCPQCVSARQTCRPLTAASAIVPFRITRMAQSVCRSLGLCAVPNCFDAFPRLACLVAAYVASCQLQRCERHDHAHLGPRAARAAI
eukprot:6191485-Pleurochrysis_carterae.AAC.1